MLALTLHLDANAHGSRLMLAGIIIRPALPLESAQVGDFPLGDVVHFFSNNTLAGIVHLGYIAIMTLGDPFSVEFLNGTLRRYYRSQVLRDYLSLVSQALTIEEIVSPQTGEGLSSQTNSCS